MGYKICLKRTYQQNVAASNSLDDFWDGLRVEDANSKVTFSGNMLIKDFPLKDLNIQNLDPGQSSSRF